MEVSEHITALRVEGKRLSAAAASVSFDAKVPSCPDWVVRDLVRHQGGVHRWVTGVVSGPRTEPWIVDLDEVVGSWPPDTELLEWFEEGNGALVDALSEADPGLECWTFLTAPSPLTMWARRQAHETAIHRVDAELASGRPITPFSAQFAGDGIDELLSCFITRRGGHLLANPPRSLHVRCVDIAGDWLVRIGADRVETIRASDTADCETAGRASDLYLALWNRKSPAALTIEGDSRVLDLFLDQVHVRW